MDYFDSQRSISSFVRNFRSREKKQTRRKEVETSNRLGSKFGRDTHPLLQKISLSLSIYRIHRMSREGEESFCSPFHNRRKHRRVQTRRSGPAQPTNQFHHGTKLLLISSE
jgi:hypothetical protein